PASCAGGMDALRQVISATAPVTAESPRAGDGGRPCDLAHAVEVLAHNTELAAASGGGIRSP
ncbi:MAG: hypothetical protein JO198_06755, partial [Candidatus Dormibacteraeota bacterium]|nr:hypothetical protein [Candidatus Dormibacteraeota bacterium]